MAYINEEQRRRWTRNNADLYIRHDAERFFLPGRCPEEFKPRHRRNSVDRSVSQPAEDVELALSPQEVEAIENERLAIRRELASMRLELALLRFKTIPNSRAYRRAIPMAVNGRMTVRSPTSRLAYALRGRRKSPGSGRQTPGTGPPPPRPSRSG